MKSSLTWKDYQRLEFDAPQHHANWLPWVYSSLQTGWKHFWAILFATEPRVWQHKDQVGRTEWHVYYPAKGQFAQFSSEADVRSWLEEQYYQ